MKELRYPALNEMRLNGEHIDLTIWVKGTSFQVHKIILCNNCPYFHDQILGNKFSGDQYIIDIPELSVNIFSLIIEYIYLGSVAITEETAMELLLMAHHFLMSFLVEDCCQFLETHLCPKTCITIYKCSENIPSCSKLHQNVKRYIQQHFEEVVNLSRDFLELSLNQLQEIINDDELNVKSEELLFEAILHWIGHDPETRNTHMDELLPMVRLGLMKPAYLNRNVSINALVEKSKFCTQLVRRIMKPTDKSTAEVRRLSCPRIPYEVLFAFGGFNNDGASNEIEAYDMRAKCWVQLAQPAETRRSYHGTVVLDQCVYCIGGSNEDQPFNSVSKFDLRTQSWHTVANMHERRCHVSVTILDGLIYAMGGFNGHPRKRQKTAERYDPRTNQWTLLPPMNVERSDSNATTLGGLIYICGGFDGKEALSSVECYNPETNSWDFLQPMGKCRCGNGVVAWGNLIYAVGGRDNISHLSCAEVYNPETNIWQEITSMKSMRGNFGMQVIDDLLYVVGGYTGTMFTDKVEFYDKWTNEWCEAESLHTARGALSCCVASGLPKVQQYIPIRDPLPAEEMNL